MEEVPGRDHRVPLAQSSSEGTIRCDTEKGLEHLMRRREYSEEVG